MAFMEAILLASETWIPSVPSNIPNGSKALGAQNFKASGWSG
jgi:hypothetical protein